ncbi:MAG: M48 family metallopeptidase [Clostridiales bacterium]|nr:M48 family metallopeptidase [Clostridiales bacterium]
MNNSILLKNKQNMTITVEYEVFRSKRKSYSLSLNENGILIVRIPLYVHDKEVEQILSQKQFWITDRLEEYEERQRSKPINNYTKTQRLALEKRYKEAARELIPKRAAYYISAYPALFPHSYSRITVRDQKTRWGSCSSKGTLSFNWRLMLAPPAVLDYVIVHELCHLTHMNHSRDFWECVGTILPDYKKHKKWLKEHGHELTLS